MNNTTEIREKPILFSAPMVRALLAGTKTQTRRVVKPQPPFGCRYVINGAYSNALCQSIDRTEVWVPPTARSVDHRLPCPYGHTGDDLWVRETWASRGVDVQPDGRRCAVIEYRADGERIVTPHEPIQREVANWKPSIFMPRWASRIQLCITDIRVERLQDISESDARAEGCPLTHDGKHYDPPSREVDSWQGYGTYSYSLLWSKINGPGSWDANPYVWVITFRRILP